MTRKRRRLWILLLCALGLGSATALVLTALDDHLVFFFSPSDLAERPPPPERLFRVGGLVETGSVERAEGSTVRFRVTDGAKTLPVTFQGLLPDLFREGQGVVAQGRLGPDGVFRATEVLARHDETYMPPEVADALRRAGHWKPGDPLPGGAPSGTPAGAPRPASGS
ncbi:MAG: cytochrome c maturation protein CcmE [Alphaproteobacteria bacterium]|nr:cytochrome c maturation protein CcmE [Alphaproteobacteria bacterium]